jgi:hypothetical protein
MTVLFSDGFECPPNTAPSTFTAWDSTSGTPVLSTTLPYSGAYSMELALSGSGIYPRKGYGGPYTKAFVQFKVRFSNLPTVGSYQQLQLSYFGTTGAPQVRVDDRGDGVHWSLNGTTYSTGTISANTWYTVEVEYNDDTNSHNLWVNGSLVLTLVNDYGTNNSAIYVGNIYTDWTCTGNLYIDDVIVSDSYTGIYSTGYSDDED